MNTSNPSRIARATCAVPVVALALAAVTTVPAAAAPSPRASVADARLMEDDATAEVVLAVTLSRKPKRSVVLRYVTADATATAGTDYFARTGRLTFRRGQRRKQIRVIVRPDAVDEADEAFTVRLLRARGAKVGLARRTATATLVDDDGPAGTAPEAPFTDRVQATINLDYRTMKIQQCQSNNDGRPGSPPSGIYAELETVYDGAVTSQDPRLAGTIDAVGKGLARAEPDDGPFLPDTGQAGIVQGPFTITAAADGRKTKGTFFATVGRSASAGSAGVLQFEGLLQGSVDYQTPAKRTATDDGDFDGGQIIGSFRGASDTWTADKVTLDLGGLSADDAEQPAFIQGGECGGPVQNRKRGDPVFAPMPGPPSR
jgi:hypothetical protein